MVSFSFLEDYKLIKSQIAENGNWEHAVELNFSENSGFLEEKRSGDTAIEFFFKNIKGDIAFIGFRLREFSFAEQNGIILSCLNTLEFNQYFEDVRKTLGNILNISDFVSTKPDFLEIGAEGFWKTYGSQVIWKNGLQPAFTISEIKSKAPQLLETFKRPMMMEVAWKKPIPIWLALQVSDPTDKGLFYFSEERYKQYLEKVLDE